MAAQRKRATRKKATRKKATRKKATRKKAASSGGIAMQDAGEATTLFFSPWYRKGPYFEASRRHGATAYEIYNHMYMPAYCHGGQEEYWKLVRDVTLWDVAGERQVEITGPDAFAFTNLLTPRDLTKCRVGQCRYVVLTDEKGGIVNDPVLARLGENHFWLSLADSDALLWAKGVAVHSGMSVQIQEPDVSPLQVQGPKSKQVVQALFGYAVSALPYYHLLETKLDGIPVVVTRTGWSAEMGYEIYLRDGSRGDELWERVMEAGRPFGIMVTAPSDIRKIEAGILNYGSDMTLENNPYEVDLGRLVDLDKKVDFVGKQALARIQAEGVKRKLVGVEIEGDRLEGRFTEFWPVRKNGGRIGHLTEVVYSPRLEKTIGYAWVPIEQAGLGTPLTIDTPEGEKTAKVVRKPFIDPTKKTPRV